VRGAVWRQSLQKTRRDIVQPTWSEMSGDVRTRHFQDIEKCPTDVRKLHDCVAKLGGFFQLGADLSIGELEALSTESVH
jgi:hypothetical protein